MSYLVDNAVILAAGTSSRFAPISYERPKALIPVKGEILIERQIRQILEAGIPKIAVVVGYKKEQFVYLKEKFGVTLLENPEYLTRNNNGSIYVARNFLRNTYVCSADNYFVRNPFERQVEESYYAALYSEGPTSEWCMREDEKGYIKEVQIGGTGAWYMLGHVFWSEKFSQNFLHILEEEYQWPETRDKLWEYIFIEHLEELPMKLRKYHLGDIYEFDSLDELREFDPAYKISSGSVILADLAKRLRCREGELVGISPWKNEKGVTIGIEFQGPEGLYQYHYETERLEELGRFSIFAF
ncbi:MAG: NTP transferase domain-containing protein [Lachnospiraceae bacterium]|nr:NTP transferase domain-containing protein [Lachnospiraceae bacterium]